MGRTRPPYPAEFHQQIARPVRTGKTSAELSREFGPSGQGPSPTDHGTPLPDKEGLGTAERQVEQERGILAEACGCSPQDTTRRSPRIRTHGSDSRTDADNALPTRARRPESTIHHSGRSASTPALPLVINAGISVRLSMGVVGDADDCQTASARFCMNLKVLTKLALRSRRHAAGA